MENTSEIFSIVFKQTLITLLKQVTFQATKICSCETGFKKVFPTDKIATGQSALFLIYLKFMKGVSIRNQRNILRQCYPNIKCCFRKAHNVINALLPMIEKWRKFLGEGNAFGVLLSDLSKAFHCLPHELLIAKVHAYGIDIPSLKLLHS